MNYPSSLSWYGGPKFRNRWHRCNHTVARVQQWRKTNLQKPPHGGTGATVKTNLRPIAIGGAGATLLYSSHNEVATNTADSDGTGKLKARVQRGDAIANLSGDTFQTFGAVALKSLAQLHAELPDILKSWPPISQNTSEQGGKKGIQIV